MKKLIVLLIFCFVFNCTFAFVQWTSPLTNRFFLGSFGAPSVGNYHRPLFFYKYDSLNYNMFIGYIDHLNYDTVCKLYGGFYDFTSVYSANQEALVNGFYDYYNNKGGFFILLEREKILRPAYGQSSIYQANTACLLV
jgi:hypothetical protein